tara:strand:- start:233 stop:370 length:138 start_codon:yes stop_codon:yes gene_type:complete
LFEINPKKGNRNNNIVIILSGSFLLNKKINKPKKIKINIIKNFKN